MKPSDELAGAINRFMVTRLMSISSLKIPGRTKGALRRVGISTVAGLVALTEHQLLTTHGVGKLGAASVQAALKDLGLSLANKPSVADLKELDRVVSKGFIDAWNTALDASALVAQQFPNGSPIAEEILKLKK